MSEVGESGVLNIIQADVCTIKTSGTYRVGLIEKVDENRNLRPAKSL